MSKCAVIQENLLIARSLLLNALANIDFKENEWEIRQIKAELSMNLCSLLDPKKYACNIKLLNYGEQKRKGRNR